ncbi:hypothetical protein [Paenibacillus sp. FSL H7-0331]|uniref:hypothetical protein n=1 Tax=Paenibacillus sp. FSL H7-0331 TaxID=1920421 RepID=UPI002115E6CB|nr:hypothetical protein [Paenibacillus sp. FSL H7-0331]
MKTPLDETMWYAYPGTVVLVTVRHEGKQNIMASGWHTYIESRQAFTVFRFARKRTRIG